MELTAVLTVYYYRGVTLLSIGPAASDSSCIGMHLKTGLMAILRKEPFNDSCIGCR